MYFRAALVTLAASTTIGAAHAEVMQVGSPAEYAAAAKRAVPGDTIVLRDGEWRDFQIIFSAKGDANRPIRLTAQTKGGVILTGQSNLRIGGEHLVISGLVFRDGYSPTGEVIAFRRDSKTAARNVRITEIVIDGFSKPDRRAEDIWVAIYGQDNRVDHSHFANKTNAGVTLAVIRPEGQPQANRARIDHNYFGHRAALGSNGGETIRIGTSEESLTDSASVVEHNIFEDCNGEVEIVSIKSGSNVLRENLVLRSQGAFVLRHGNGNLVERNIFLGQGKRDTGGVRVINHDQTVRDNYFEGLAGDGFRSALTVMNGVPNSVINRYHQVVNARMERNSFIDVAAITFAAAADVERSAAPVESVFAGNLVRGATGNPLTSVGDASGIAVRGNLMTHETPVALARAANGLLYPTDLALAEIGAPRDLSMLTRAEVGPDWYRAPGPLAPRTIVVAPGGSIGDAVAASAPGDTIRLGSGDYRLSSELAPRHGVRVEGAGQDKTRIIFASPALLAITGGHPYSLSGVTIIAGAGAKSVIRVASGAQGNYALELDGVGVEGAAAGSAFDVVATTAGTFGDRIAIRGSQFRAISGAVVAATAEQGNKGWYPVEVVEISGSSFSNVGMVADVLRRGTDESTFGPYFTLMSSVVERSGAGGASVRLHGAQSATIKGNRFVASAPVVVEHSVGTPFTTITGNSFVGTPAPQVRETHYTGPLRARIVENKVQR